MCLGVPGKVVDVDGLLATVDFWGVRKQVRLDVVDQPVAPGDYILNHVGFAIRRIPADEIGETLALYEQLLALEPAVDIGSAGPLPVGSLGDSTSDRPLAGDEDLMAADVRDEIAAGVSPPSRPRGDRQ
jgi:hydrogenase expression/formation protein HypC